MEFIKPSSLVFQDSNDGIKICDKSIMKGLFMVNNIDLLVIRLYVMIFLILAIIISESPCLVATIPLSLR